MIKRILCLAAAILCISYGLIVRAVGSGTGFFMVWLVLGAGFLLLALFLRLQIWCRLPMAVRYTVPVLVGIVLTAFVVIEGCVLSHFHDEGEEDLQYIIVLGAQVYQSGPSPVLKYRLDRAAEYLENNPDTICIVSGGQGGNEPCAEADTMAEYLQAKGIASRRIIREDRSLTTQQNIRNSRKYLPEGASVGIVTNNFHVFRALQIARSEGLSPVCGIAAPTTPLYLPNNMVREFFGEVKYLLQIFFK